ncbi:hypothetical protein EHS17_03870 [Rhodobacteraceae bacterium CH30]|nr:hypothetical protein EHS17_03870 [Rhodobacteraceae bacterium CH30]
MTSTSINIKTAAEIKAEVIASETLNDTKAIEATQEAFAVLMEAAEAFDKAWNKLTLAQKAMRYSECHSMFGSLINDYQGGYSGGRIGSYEPKKGGMPQVVGQAVTISLPKEIRAAMDSIVMVEVDASKQAATEAARKEAAEKLDKANVVAQGMGFKDAKEMLKALQEADIVERQTFTFGV